MELTQRSNQEYRREGLEYLTEKLIRDSEFFSSQLKIDFIPESLEVTSDDLNCLHKDRLSLIERLYGLILDEYPTLKEVGNEVNLTRQRVSQKIAESSQELYRIIAKREWQSKYSYDNPELPIALTELSRRIKAAFLSDKSIKGDVRTVKDITKYSKRELMFFKNFGQKSCNEVSEYLQRFGLKLE